MARYRTRSSSADLAVLLVLALAFTLIPFPGLFSSLLPLLSGLLLGLGGLLRIGRLNGWLLNGWPRCEGRCSGRAGADVDVYAGALLGLGPLRGIRVDDYVRRYRVARGREVLAEYEASVGEVGLGCYRPVEIGHLHTGSTRILRAKLIFWISQSCGVEALKEARSIEEAAEQD